MDNQKTIPTRNSISSGATTCSPRANDGIETTADQLDGLADRIFNIPVIYGVDQGDVEMLQRVAKEYRAMQSLATMCHECIGDQKNGMDVLASASMDEMIAWMKTHDQIIEQCKYDRFCKRCEDTGVEVQRWQDGKRVVDCCLRCRTPPRWMEVGSVYVDAEGRKHIVRKDMRAIEKGERFVCDQPHGDGDFGYSCGSEHCRCMR